ncbi:MULTISPECIES: cytochrome C6 [Synechococcaceae]|uniref:cytochrome C6 n=1 Tax=Synechococcaceae TaxID=1890426 RepID=UPI001F3DC620|nr:MULTISPECIES: cytochrome C6 [Synechococcaceae]MCT4363823.1 cytochrome C6 [Candidatus Regnicoccus frigidus MAG-AL1]MCT4366542.1 cytochrome C6 [Candidatus Regnicoccus frigidus MAG-AL2]
MNSNSPAFQTNSLAATAARVGFWWRRLLVWAAVLGLSLLISWPRAAYGATTKSLAGSLFEAHCAGCHVNGGNILRRGKTLKLAALERNGVGGPEAIAAIAAGGIGQMGGYGAVLGEGGAELVGDWVWQQALNNWAAESPKA